MKIYAFECNVRGKDWHKIINTTTVGKAKSLYLNDVQDPWPDIQYIQVTGRKIGPAITSKEFKKNAAYRGIPDLLCGDFVAWEGGWGIVVGHDCSANIVVEMLDGSRVSIHPDSITQCDRDIKLPV